ncbi:hypothetical protein CQA66_01595 [Helicobacter aurati]|uniref:TerB family tellurite resistance protein n=1 Tax=Helicobacter aurati TaxID=137778 RepID=A0A3D8J888_9HELI|nr:hypothetical protein [Helicobacter aurati]RDU73385.1 hypothetical protein CQA66_01595 [Helicobacter aurati]
MFLNLLNQEEKNIFLEFAHHIAWSNNDFSDAQKRIIATYCLEMQVEDIKYDRNNEDNFNITQTLAKVTNPQSQRIMLLESMALVFAEHVSRLDSIHKEERRVIDEMIQAFGLNTSYAVIYSEWTKAMLSLANQGRALIKI